MRAKVGLCGNALAGALALSCGGRSNPDFITLMKSVQPLPTGAVDATHQAAVLATKDALLKTIEAVPTNVVVELTCEAVAGHAKTPLPSAAAALAPSCTATPTPTP